MTETVIVNSDSIGPESEDDEAIFAISAWPDQIILPRAIDDHHDIT